MTFFVPADFAIFSEQHSGDPSGDADRVRLRDKLEFLHQKIYPEIRTRRWDLHPHWKPEYLISTAMVSRMAPRIDFLLLRYSKAETVVKLMKKELGEDFTHPFATALLGVRAIQSGLSIEMLVPDAAWADAQNFKNKLEHGAPEKRHLRQILAELGGDYTLTLESVKKVDDEMESSEAIRVKCSRLVNLGTLDSTMSKFAPAEQRLRVAAHYAVNDPRMETDTLPAEVIYRMGQLYMLYQFVSWSPRNDYVPRANAQDRESESNL